MFGWTRIAILSSGGFGQSWIFEAEAWNFDYDYKSLEASELRTVKQVSYFEVRGCVAYVA